jgi:kinesin family protein 20
MGNKADPSLVTFQVELNEMRMDAKIDMLHRSGVIGKTPRGLPSHKSGESDARNWGTEVVSRMVLLHRYLPLKRLSA